MSSWPRTKPPSSLRESGLALVQLMPAPCRGPGATLPLVEAGWVDVAPVRLGSWAVVSGGLWSMFISETNMTPKGFTWWTAHTGLACPRTPSPVPTVGATAVAE